MDGIPYQLRHIWQRLVARAGHEPLIMLTVLLVSAALRAFAALADAIVEPTFKEYWQMVMIFHFDIVLKATQTSSLRQKCPSSG